MSYGIIETNGKLSILENTEVQAPASIPTTLIVEGRFMSENMQTLDITAEQVQKVLDEQQLDKKNVVLMTAESNKLFIQPKNEKFRIVEVA